MLKYCSVLLFEAAEVFVVCVMVNLL